MVQIIWNDLALQDLRNIGEALGRVSPSYASATVDRLMEIVELIGAFPELGESVHHSKLKNLRQFCVGRHLLVYRYLSGQKVVRIVAIADARWDTRDQFRDRETREDDRTDP